MTNIQSYFAPLIAAAFALSLSLAAAQVAPAPERVFRDCEGCPEMVTLPPGKFMMGASDEDRKVPGTQYAIPVELPQHQVTIDYSFAIGKYVVTVEEFGRFINETGYKAGGECTIVVATHGPLKGKFQGRLSPDWKEAWIKVGNAMIVDASYRHQGQDVSARHPAICISRIEAQAYLVWLSSKTGRKYRFPTEAEWEYAARAGEDLPFYWGKDLNAACSYANFQDKLAPYHPMARGKCVENPSFPYTAPVGSFKPNQWGLFDMVGNVQQFMEDCYVDGYVGAPTDGSPWLKGDHPRLNRADGRCVQWSSRGYSFISQVSALRSASRCSVEKDDTRSAVVGLRVAVSLTPNAWDQK
jgi:formylglycine-generating enzyme required for sulfatase activity